jgi:hypothetical protein
MNSHQRRTDKRRRIAYFLAVKNNPSRSVELYRAAGLLRMGDLVALGAEGVYPIGTSDIVEFPDGTAALDVTFSFDFNLYYGHTDKPNEADPKEII